jgi:hypothetical protein
LLAINFQIAEYLDLIHVSDNVVRKIFHGKHHSAAFYRWGEQPRSVLSPHPTEASWGKLFCQAAKGLMKKKKLTASHPHSLQFHYDHLYDDDSQEFQNAT